MSKPKLRYMDFRVFHSKDLKETAMRDKEFDDFIDSRVTKFEQVETIIISFEPLIQLRRVWYWE